VVTAALLVVLTIVLPGAVLRGETFVSADAQNADVFAAVGDASLAKGHYPLWNPYLFAGMPTFGSLAYVKFLYPPTALFNFLQQKLGFPPLTWLLAHLLVGGVGVAYLLSRWRLPVAALILGGLVWVMFPKVVAWGVLGHGSKLGAAMYLPWIVAWGWQVLDGRGARAVAITGLLLGLQFLRSHPQITYYTLLLLGWLAACNGVWPLSEPSRAVSASIRWRRVALLGLAIAIGFAIGAIMLLPVHHYAGLSIRGQDTGGGGGAGFEYATNWSMAPAELSTFVLPSTAGFGKASYLGMMPFNDYPNYFGGLLLSLAVLAWWTGRRRLFGVLAIMSLLALLVSFGRHAPFYRLLYDLLPFFNKFRVPSMILIVPAFAVSILAALGAARLARAADGDRPSRILSLILMAGGGMLLLGGITGLGEGAFTGNLRDLAAKGGKSAHPDLLAAAWRLHTADLVRIGLILLAGGAALWYGVKKTVFRRRGLLWVLALLLLVDLHGVDRRIVSPDRSLLQVVAGPDGRATLARAGAPGQPYRPTLGLFAPDPALPVLRAAVGHDRVWPLGQPALENRYLQEGLRSLGGYHAAKLASFEQVRRRLNSERPAGRIASWLAAQAVVLEQPLPAEAMPIVAELGFELDPEPLYSAATTVYRNRSALPRARLVSQYRLVETLPQGGALGPFLDAIQAGQIDVAEQVLLEHDPQPRPQPPATDGPLPSPVYVRDALDEVVLRTAAPTATLLVLADMYAPGWRADIDGQPAEVLRADLILRAVAVPPGEHEVRFVYQDDSVRAGLAISLAGIGGVLLLLLLPLARRPREDSSDD